MIADPRRHVSVVVRRPRKRVTARVIASYPKDADQNDVLLAISDAAEQAVLDYLEWRSEQDAVRAGA